MKVNNKIVDLWSIQHFLSGIIIGLILRWLCPHWTILENNQMFWIIGISSLAIWELIEASLRIIGKNKNKLYKTLIKFVPKAYFVLESRKNILSDIIVGSIGIGIIYIFF